jgi:hypothetical protein
MPSQQRPGRVAVNSTLAVILVLVAILSPFVGAPTTNVAAIAAASAARADSASHPTARKSSSSAPSIQTIRRAACGS